MRCARLFIVLIGCLLATSAVAQHNPVFTSYGVDNGLPQNSVWNITQDKNGFLWVSTSDGVCRFDGYNFNIYRSRQGDKNSIAAGAQPRLYTDSTGNLWAISKGGISFYNSVNDNFNRIISFENTEDRESFDCFIGEDAHYIWASLTNYGFLKIDKHSRTVIKVPQTRYRTFLTAASWQSGFIDNGKIWMGGSHSNCYVYDIAANKLTQLPIAYVYTLRNFNDSQCIAATWDELILINKEDYSYERIPVNEPKQHSAFTDILVSSPSEVILASPQGLIYINPETRRTTRRIKSFTPGKRNSYSYVQCIYKDRSGNLWIGTNGDGLKKITAPHKNFKFYSSFSDTSNIVKSIYALGDKLFAGYYSNGFDIFNRTKGLFRSVAAADIPAQIKSVYALVATDGNTLLLQNREELYQYSIPSGTFRSLSGPIKQLVPYSPNKRYECPFFLQANDTIYLSASDHLIAFNTTHLPTIKPWVVHHFNGEMLTCAFIDSKHRLWAGTIKGLFYRQGTTWQKLLLPEAIQVKAVNEDNKGNTWVCTVSGIYVIDNNGNISQHYDESNGLSNHFVYGILRDDNGNMWFSHNKGISRYSTASRSFRHYTREDGLQSNEFNTGAYFKSADGELFFGGINGVNSFKPVDITDNPHTPHAAITQVNLFDLPLKTDTTYWELHNLKLPYNRNTLSFEFAAIEFTNPAGNRYKYMLEGLDKDWIDAGDRRFVRYPSVPPGNYLFKVKASNNDGIWQTRPTVIAITITPPFWQQWWFRIMAAVLLLFSVGGIVAWVQRQRHKRQVRALELQQKIQLERERISRDLHDNVGTQLSLISNNIEWVTRPLKEIGDKEKSEKLQFVNEAAKGIIATLRETIWALNKEQIHFEEFSDKLKVFLQKQLVPYPGITLDYNESIATDAILSPSEALNLFRICQEAVTNSLKYANATSISIELKDANGYPFIRISDDGRGFDPGTVDTSVQNGLENMKYRASDIAWQLKINTSPSTGTSIIIAKSSANAVWN